MGDYRFAVRVLEKKLVKDDVSDDFLGEEARDEIERAIDLLK
jgi:hypothetical protein